MNSQTTPTKSKSTWELIKEDFPSAIWDTFIIMLIMSPLDGCLVLLLMPIFILIGIALAIFSPCLVPIAIIALIVYFIKNPS